MKVGLLWVMQVTFPDLLLEVAEVVHEHQVVSHGINFLDCNDLPALGVQHVIDFLDKLDIELLAFLLQLKEVFLFGNLFGASHILTFHGSDGREIELEVIGSLRGLSLVWTNCFIVALISLDPTKLFSFLFSCLQGIVMHNHLLSYAIQDLKVQVARK
jgi:hypothetical protein